MFILQPLADHLLCLRILNTASVFSVTFHRRQGTFHTEERLKFTMNLATNEHHYHSFVKNWNKTRAHKCENETDSMVTAIAAPRLMVGGTQAWEGGGGELQVSL